MNRNFTEFLENIFHFLTFQFFWKISKAEIFHVILLFDFTSFFLPLDFLKFPCPLCSNKLNKNLAFEFLNCQRAAPHHQQTRKLLAKKKCR